MSGTLSDNQYGLVEQRQHRRPDRAGQRIESVHGIQAANIADGALAIIGSLFDGVAQAPELVGFAEHPAPVTFLLIGIWRTALATARSRAIADGPDLR
jgi:hypothetical protein